jgi:hypothetical protein
MPTTDPSAVTKRPWFQVSDDLGGHDEYNRDAQLARWLTYTHANMLAFDAATTAGDTRTAIAYLNRAIPAFTAAALTRGETPEWAYETCVMGDTSEFVWEWLDDLGINPDGIAPADQDVSL